MRGSFTPFPFQKDIRSFQDDRILAEQAQKGATIPLAEVYSVKAQPVRKNNKNQKNADRRGGNVPGTAKILAGPVIELAQYEDVRQPLMDWLRFRAMNATSEVPMPSITLKDVPEGLRSPESHRISAGRGSPSARHTRERTSTPSGA